MKNIGLETGLTARRLAARVVLLCLFSAGLAGCGSMVADLPVVGLPADAPARKEQGDFLPVHDLPAPRETAKIETAEQAKIRAELAAARDKQAKAAASGAK